MRILLVEDDERIVSFVKRGLEAEGYVVDVARDGLEGLDMGRANYDCIILDLLLPLKSGNDVCHELRRRQVQTPILVLTAKDTLRDKVEGLQAGADDYLTKPFAFEELIARVQALRRRGPYQEVAEVLKLADLTLNRETREVHRSGKIIDLTAKEFALLEYLMTHASKPLSRMVLLEQVWGYHYDTHTNVVDVFIGYLRKKVDGDHERKLIQTVRHIGYKISE